MGVILKMSEIFITKQMPTPTHPNLGIFFSYPPPHNFVSCLQRKSLLCDLLSLLRVPLTLDLPLLVCVIASPSSGSDLALLTNFVCKYWKYARKKWRVNFLHHFLFSQITSFPYIPVILIYRAYEDVCHRKIISPSIVQTSSLSMSILLAESYSCLYF